MAQFENMNPRQIATADFSKVKKDDVIALVRRLSHDLSVTTGGSYGTSGSCDLGGGKSGDKMTDSEVLREILVQVQSLSKDVATTNSKVEELALEQQVIRSDLSDLRDKNQVLSEKVVALDYQIKTMQTENSAVAEQNHYMNKAFDQHQRYLEYIDAKERARNLIITGVREDCELNGAETDESKCKEIMKQIGVGDISMTCYTRIGKEGEHPRPILITVESIDDKNRVLEKAKTLKEKGDEYKKIYIKKDVHPATRREWKRLNEAEKAEKEKTENAGCDVRLDYKARVLTRDGVIIDRWQPTYFH